MIICKHAFTHAAEKVMFTFTWKKMHVRSSSRKVLSLCYQQSKRSCTTKRQVRVRFAPSPTGYLHLGGLRTALYNYLFAKKNDGRFVLRVEDTDQTRLIEGAAEQLQRDLTWAGIVIDEGPHADGGYGPYVQSERLHIYREQVKTLIDNQSAYYCFCQNKRLDLLRKEALRTRQIPKYDNKCRHLSKDEVKRKLEQSTSYCIRFKISPGLEAFDDLIYGKISYDVSLNEGDPVIMKSDGYPTYHFANVIDDHFMDISHVLRGVEWQISTTKHILMYRAFNWTPPVYGHLPLLLNADGSKLSKRQGDIHISHFKESGILPLALVNFIASSGGGFEKDQERGLKSRVFTLNELANQFDVKKINASSGKLMPERLFEFNRLEIERQLRDGNDQELVQAVKEIVETKFRDRLGSVFLQLETEHVKSVLEWSVNRINQLSDLVSHDLMFLWVAPSSSSKRCLNLKQVNAVVKLQELLREAPVDLSKEKVNVTLRVLAKESDISFSEFMKLLRSVLSGLKEGPSVGEMMEILGKENILLRLKTFLDKNTVS